MVRRAERGIGALMRDLRRKRLVLVLKRSEVPLSSSVAQVAWYCPRVGATGDDGVRHKKKRGFVARWARRAAFACVGVVVLCAGLYITRTKTLHPLIVRFAPNISRTLSEYEARIDSIEGDWRSGLEITGLRIKATTEETPLREAAFPSVRIDGKLLSFATSRDLAELERIEIVDPSVTIDTTITRSPPQTTSSIPLDGLPEFQLTNGTVTLLTKSGTTVLESINGNGNATDKSPLHLGLKASSERWSALAQADLVATADQRITFRVDLPEAQARGVQATARDVVGSWSPGAFELETGDVKIGDNRLDVQGVTLRRVNGEVTAGGRITFAFGEIQSGYVCLAEFFGDEAPSPGGSDEELRWRGQVSGTVNMTPAPGGHVATGQIDLTGENVVLDGIRLGNIRALIDANDEALVVNELHAIDGEGGSSVDGSGSYRFASKTLETVRLEAKFDQPGSLASGLSLLRGVDLALVLSGPLDAPSGVVEARAKEIRTPGFHVSELDVTGALNEGVLDLTSAKAETDYGRMDATGSITLPLAGRALGIVVRTLELDAEGLGLALQSPTAIMLKGPELRIESVDLLGSAGRLTGDVASNPVDGTTVHARATELRATPFLRRWIGPDYDLGTLDGNLSFASQPMDFDADLVLKGGRAAATGDDPVTAELKGQWTLNQLDLDAFKVEAFGVALSADGVVPLDSARGIDIDGPIDLGATIRIDEKAVHSSQASAIAESLGYADLLSRLRSSGGSMDCKLEGSWGAPKGRLAVEINEVAIARPDGIDARNRRDWFPKPVSVAFALDLSDDRIGIETGRLRAPGFVAFDVSGEVGVGLDLRAAATDTARWAESLLDAPLDGQAVLSSESLDDLAVFAPDLRETEGALQGNLRIEGSLKDPSLTGRIALNDGVARYRGAPPIENADLSLTLEEGQIRLEPSTLEIGASVVQVEGNMLLGQGAPRIAATVRGSDVLLVRSADARIRADLDLSINGRTTALNIGGDVLLTGGRVRSPIEFQGLLSSGGSAPQRVARGLRLPGFGPESVTLNTRITTKEPLRLEGRIARGGLRTDMTLRGTAAEPTPVGSVFFDPLELAVPAGTINFPSGLVQFDPNSPEIPRIDIVGTTRLAGYDVTVSVSGDYDQAEVDLASSPPLPPEDLLLLVLSGQPPRTGAGLQAAGQSVALYVAKDLVRGWFSSGSFEDNDRESFLDRLEVVTGRDVSRSGTVTVEATYKLREGLARKKDALYVVLERDAFEDYGLGLRLVLRLR